MKPLSRRSVTTGLAAAVTAIPALGFPLAAKENPMERIKRLIRELESAMLEAYGGKSKTLAFGPHSEIKKNRDLGPKAARTVLVVVHPEI